MKKPIIILFALLLSVSAFSQQDLRANEIKLNLSNTAIFLYPEISYERILNTDISAGISLGFGGTSGAYRNFNLTPYFRWFLGGKRESMQKAGSGFFIEANSAVNHYTTYFAEGFGVGAGLGVGWKYLTKNDWVIELMFGGGRDLLHDGAYLRGGLFIGKRF